MASNDWVKYICRYCDTEITDFKFIPPDCECEGFKEAKEKWLEEFRSQPDYEPPLEPEEYDEKYPQTFLGERLVTDKDSAHKLKLEARKYGDGEGLTVWIPFPHKLDEESEEESEGAGLCWDFTDKDAEALHDLLTEYLEVKNERKS